MVRQVAPVRDAAALDPAGRRRCGERGALELGQQPALADTRLADDEGSAAAARSDDVEHRGEALQLLGAPDHRAVEPHGFQAALARRRRLAPDDPVGVDRLGLALDLDLAEVVNLEGVAGQAARHLRDHDRAGLGGRLHPRGDVHRVAEGRVLVAQVGADIPDHDGPGVDAGADVEVDALCCLQLARELIGRLDHVERSEDRPLGVVFVRHRGTEERQHRVALELGDRALVAEDGPGHEVERLVDDRRPILGIDLLREPGRADDVGEQRGDGLALAGEPRVAHLRDERLGAAAVRRAWVAAASIAGAQRQPRRGPGRNWRRTSRRAPRWRRSAGRSGRAIRRSFGAHRTPGLLRSGTVPARTRASALATS